MIGVGLTTTLCTVPASVGPSTPSVRPASTIGVIFGDSRLSSERSRIALAGVDSELVPGSGVHEPHLLARGIDNWLEVLTYGQFRFPTELNFARGGDSISEQSPLIDANLSDAIADGAGFIMWLAGRNGAGAASGAQLVADAEAVMARFLAQQVPIIVIVDWPDMAPVGTPGAMFTSTQQAWDAMRALRAYYLSLADNPWITVVDAWSIMGAAGPVPALPSAEQQPFFEDQWLHQSARGAYKIARAIQPILTTWFPDVPALPASSIALPPMGTTGGNAGGGTGGNVPAGWVSTGANLAGLTVTGSAATLTVDGMTTDAHRSVVTGTAGTGGFVRFLEYQGADRLAAETTLQLSADFEVARIAGANSFFMSFQNAFGGSFSLFTLGPFADDGAPDEPFKGRFISPRVTMPAGFKPAIRFAATLGDGEAVDIDARFGNIRLVAV